MYSFFSDNVTAGRHKRERKLKNFSLVLIAFVSLALFLWISTWTEIAVEIGGEFLRKLAVDFSHRFFVFILVNFLILFIFAFSYQTEPINPDLYDRKIATCDYSPALEEEFEPTNLNKKIVCVDNAVSVPPVNQYTVLRETQPNYKPTAYSPVRGNTVSAITELKRNGKSTAQSENFEQLGNWREETKRNYKQTVYSPVRGNAVSTIAEVKGNRKSTAHLESFEQFGSWREETKRPVRGNTLSTITEVKRYRKTTTHSDCGNWRDETERNYKPTVYSPIRDDTVSTVTEVTRYRSEYSTHTESFKQCRNRRLYWGSETTVGREMVAAVARESRRRWSSTDDSSDEEFRLRAETFIATKKKTLFFSGEHRFQNSGVRRRLYGYDFV